MLSGLVEFLERIDVMENCTGFNDKAKFGFLSVPVLNIPELATFALYRGVSTYASHKKAICDFEISRSAFHSVLPQPGSTTNDLIGRQSDKDRKILVRADARVHNVESKMDALTKQLTDLTLIMKKSQENASKPPDSG